MILHHQGTKCSKPRTSLDPSTTSPTNPTIPTTLLPLLLQAADARGPWGTAVPHEDAVADWAAVSRGGSGLMRHGACGVTAMSFRQSPSAPSPLTSSLCQST